MFRVYIGFGVQELHGWFLLGTEVIAHIKGLTTSLIATHEPPSIL